MHPFLLRFPRSKAPGRCRRTRSSAIAASERLDLCSINASLALASPKVQMTRHWLHFIEHAVILDDGSSSSSGSHSNSSLGMLFVVLVVIIVLGLLAGLLAQICGGRHLGGYIEYDFEGWVERTCASCIDGSIPITASRDGGGGAAATKPAGEGAGGGGSDAGKPAEGSGGGESKSADEKKGPDGGEKSGRESSGEKKEGG